LNRSLALSRVTATISLLAVGLWLGGLLALGAIAAPVVFSVVPLPTSADAMTVVFRRFDQVAMACGAIVLASEAMRVVGGVAFARADQIGAAASVLACALAVFEGMHIAPRIAALHMGGAVRGIGDAGLELHRLHELAEACGKAEVLLLVVVVAAHVVALSRRAP
jgi:hypothetical protein